MKNCPQCSTSKTADKFNKDSSKKDGLDWRCKFCSSKNKSRDWGRKREYEKEWRKTAAGKRNRILNVRRSEKKYPEKFKARLAVRHALQSGRIERPSTCQDCNKKSGRI